MSRRDVLRAAGSGAIGATGLALVGCGDDDDAAPAPTRMESSEALASKDTEEAQDLSVAEDLVEPEVRRETLAPVQDRTPISGDAPPVVEDIRSGDALVALDTADLRRSISPISERWLGQLLYSKLLRFQDVAAAELVPDLAITLPEVADSSALVFELNPKAHWDARAPTEGRGVSAEDVRSTIESQRDRLDPTFARHDRLLDLRVEVVGPSTVRIAVEGGDARLPGLLASSWMGVLPSELLDDEISAPEAQRGSGPFILERVDADGWRFCANPAHHLGAPHLADLHVASRLASEQVEAFVRGEQNVLERIPTAVARDVAGPDAAVLVTGLATVLHLFFQVQRPPWDDPRRRLAVHLALDRSALAAAWFGEGAGPSGYVPPPLATWALGASDLASLPGYSSSEADLRAATALWEAAGGFPTPEPLALAVPAREEREIAPGARIAARLAEVLGAEAQVVPLEDAELVSAIVDGRSLWFLESAPSSPEPLDFIVPLFHSRGSLNRFGFVDAEVDETIASLIATTNPEIRQQRLSQFQRRLLELVPSIPLLYPAHATAMHVGVRGRRLDVLDNSWQWAEVEADA